MRAHSVTRSPDRLVKASAKERDGPRRADRLSGNVYREETIETHSRIIERLKSVLTSRLSINCVRFFLARLIYEICMPGRRASGGTARRETEREVQRSAQPVAISGCELSAVVDSVHIAKARSTSPQRVHSGAAHVITLLLRFNDLIVSTK